MYVPSAFAVDSSEAVRWFIQQHPLATVIVHCDSTLSADHLPLLLVESQSNEKAADSVHNWCMLGHIARANPLATKAAQGLDCLAIFQGHDHYISPNAYATKQQHGQVVPTWNYEAVHVNGHLQLLDQPQQLRELLEKLTDHHEANQAVAWRMSDAPEEYLQRMMKAIVGIRIEVRQVVGKAKLSQNQPHENRRSVAEHLANQADSKAKAMGAAIRDGSTWVQ